MGWVDTLAFSQDVQIQLCFSNGVLKLFFELNIVTD
jgi:hypothetical protein